MRDNNVIPFKDLLPTTEECEEVRKQLCAWLGERTVEQKYLVSDWSGCFKAFKTYCFTSGSFKWYSTGVNSWQLPNISVKSNLYSVNLSKKADTKLLTRSKGIGCFFPRGFFFLFFYKVFFFVWTHKSHLVLISDSIYLWLWTVLTLTVSNKQEKIRNRP